MEGRELKETQVKSVILVLLVSVCYVLMRRGRILDFKHADSVDAELEPQLSWFGFIQRYSVPVIPHMKVHK